MQKLVIIIPIYKEQLDALEHYSLNRSVAVLSAQQHVVFIGSENLPRAYYTEHYPQIPFMAFSESHFSSIANYNRLLLSHYFYKVFINYQFLLVLQTDAIILRDECEYWCAQPFDYIGAPWPDGYELFVNAGRFEGEYGKAVKVFVGNGGLSLRRIDKCLALLDEFKDILDVFERTGSSEDLFFSVMGALSNNFIIPNEIIASRFSMELKPSLYLTINGGHLPMGGHAWWKYEPDFWRQQFAEQLSALPEAWLNHG
jgi:hypothetical protein